MPFQDFIEDSPIPQNPIQGAAAEFQQEAPSSADLLGNAVSDGFSRKAGSFLAETAVRGTDVLSDAFGMNLQNTQKMSADQINASAPIGNDGKPTKITDDPMYENVANMLIEDKKRQLVNENMISRYANAKGMLPTFAVGAAAFLADPSDIAMTAYGGAVLGGSKVLAGLDALGVDTASVAARTTARVVSGAVGGTASMVPLAGAQLGISAYQGGDYDVHSALNDLAFGAVGGALLHGGFGSALHEGGILKPDELMRAQALKTDFQAQASDILRQPAPVKAAAINSTIADIVNGRPADPESVIGRGGQPPDLSQVADDRTQQNQNGYSPNMTPEEIAAARKTILPDGIKVETKPSRLPDDEINRYQGTVKQSLVDAGVTNVDDSVVRELARMRAEQINPEGAVKPRSAAEVKAGDENPNPVWKSVDITPKPVESAPSDVSAYKTAKGSTYEVHDDGTTTRNKAARNDVGHEGDFGPKARSEKTIYVDNQGHAVALSSAGVQNASKHKFHLVMRDGKASLVSWNEQKNGWGVAPESKDIPFTTKPEVGKYPVEAWGRSNEVNGLDGYRKQHAGNEITEVSRDGRSEKTLGSPNKTPETFPALPKELKGAKSGYKQAVPQFASDVDKALYIVREKSSGKSKSHDKYIDYLKNTVGLSDGEIRKGSEDVLNAVKANAEGKTGNVDIPTTFKRAKDTPTPEMTAENKKMQASINRSEAAKNRKAAPPKNIFQSIAQAGGLKDEGGFLKNRDMRGVMTQHGRLYQKGGMDYEQAYDHAVAKGWIDDTGYDENNPDHVDKKQALFDALEQEHTGRKEKAVDYEDDIERHAGEMGIDTAGMKPEEIRAELEARTKEAAFEKNFVEELRDERSENAHDYYPDMEEANADEAAPEETHTGHEPEVGAGNERPEPKAGNEGRGEGAEPVNAGDAGRGAEGAGTDAGRTGADDGSTASGASGEVVTKGDLYKLPRESLEQMREETQLSDHEKLIKALGSDEEAKRFNRLVRQSESMDHARADKASKELGEIEDKLTPEQQKLVYGIGETGATKEDLDELIKAHSDITFTPHDDIKDIGYIGTLGIRKMLPEEILSVKEGNASIAAQAALIRFKGAFDELRNRGLSGEESLKAMAQGMSEKSGMSMGDATDFVRDFSDALKEKRGVKEPTFEPAKNVAGGGEQGVLGGMEQSAKQAMAARGEKIGAKVEQKAADEGLFASVIGGGDQLDLRIADAEKIVNQSGMTVEERADLQQTYKEAADADKVYSDKLKELGQCLSENGV